MTKLVVSLCDLTGNLVQPWLAAGYEAVLVDPQHRWSRKRGGLHLIAGTVEEALPVLGWYMQRWEVALVAGFPPCTDLAVSGARWWQDKRRADPHFQTKASLVVEQCRVVGSMSGAPWFVENPVGALSNVLGKPDYMFHPHDFTGWCKDDNYTKKTCLWTGNGFIMPNKRVAQGLGKPDDRIHTAGPGPERSNIRSATPMGFSRAVFHANRN